MAFTEEEMQKYAADVQKIMRAALLASIGLLPNEKQTPHNARDIFRAVSEEMLECVKSAAEALLALSHHGKKPDECTVLEAVLFETIPMFAWIVSNAGGPTAPADDLLHQLQHFMQTFAAYAAKFNIPRASIEKSIAYGLDNPDTYGDAPEIPNHAGTDTKH